MRVVVVDPSRTVLKCVGRILEAGHHEVLPFTDGAAALAHVKADLDVGAVITSSELGAMSGLELCWETRVLAGGHRPIYIILMSSSDERDNLVEALDMGADDFIGKPPVPAQLYARLRAAGRLAAMQRDLIRLATTDPLTGVLNRRAFFERATHECGRAEAGEPLCAIMFDIDHFKRINDSYGHDAGDECIRGVAQEASIEGAVLGRLGGEEFALLLPGKDSGAATECAEHLRLQLAARQFATRSQVLTLTCSLGVSQWEAGDTIDSLLQRADAALYAAKTGGRNRVVAADSSLPVHDHRRAGRPVRSGPRAADAAVAAPQQRATAV